MRKTTKQNPATTQPGTPKLAFRREQVRELLADDLAAVVGGMSWGAGNVNN